MYECVTEILGKRQEQKQPIFFGGKESLSWTFESWRWLHDGEAELNGSQMSQGSVTCTVFQGFQCGQDQEAVLGRIPSVDHNLEDVERAEKGSPGVCFC